MSIKNHIVLLEPEIPQNTGNIARTCAVTDTALYLIHPLGFSTEDKMVRRAGMDYWQQVKVYHYENWEDFLLKNQNEKEFYQNLFYLTTKGKKLYSDAPLQNGGWFVFGKESAGIPEPILKKDEERCIRIPMGKSYRSLNLSNCAAIVLYEALRQQNFNDLNRIGHFHY